MYQLFYNPTCISNSKNRAIINDSVSTSEFNSKKSAKESEWINQCDQELLGIECVNTTHLQKSFCNYLTNFSHLLDHLWYCEISKIRIVYLQLFCQTGMDDFMDGVWNYISSTDDNQCTRNRDASTISVRWSRRENSYSLSTTITDVFQGIWCCVFVSIACQSLSREIARREENGMSINHRNTMLSEIWRNRRVCEEWILEVWEKCFDCFKRWILHRCDQLLTAALDPIIVLIESMLAFMPTE